MFSYICLLRARPPPVSLLRLALMFPQCRATAPEGDLIMYTCVCVYIYIYIYIYVCLLVRAKTGVRTKPTGYDLSKTGWASITKGGGLRPKP